MKQLITGFLLSLNICLTGQPEADLYDKARSNAEQSAESLRRCNSYLTGWLALRDPDSGLIPRNTKNAFWNAKDAAADNYPFMVLSSWFTNEAHFSGVMRDMLAQEIKLTSRIDRLPDTYDFTTDRFQSETANLPDILFGSSEYIKDGLLPLTEWLGPSPWSERMIGILDDIWKHAQVATPYGIIPSENVELNGELLQVLSRVYFMTGDSKYLDWAVRLGDFYLLGNQHPTENMEQLRLRDHGCEIVSGLCELYAAVHFARPQKKQQYREPIHTMLDRILEVGRNEHGLFFNEINPVSGAVINPGIADTWGYTYNGFYLVYLIDGEKRYLEAVRKPLSLLQQHYHVFDWERGSSDGYADTIESALNLINREHVASAAHWIDREIQIMWSKQQDSGIIEGWHGDGNFARTSIMYSLWKTCGVSAHPWREDLRIGAVQVADTLYLILSSSKAWKGQLKFDAPRHRTHFNLPIDWPRINQFPEWFTVEHEKLYSITKPDEDYAQSFSGDELSRGLLMSLADGEYLRLKITEAKQ